MFTAILGHEFPRVMAFMKPRIWRYATGMLGMTAMTTGLRIVQAFTLKYVMQAGLEKQLSLLITGLAILIGGTVFAIIVHPFFVYRYNSCAHITAAEIRCAVFQHVSRLPVSYFEESHSGDVIARLTTDTTVMIDIFTHKLRRFLAPSVFAGGSAVAMLFMDWRIGTGLIIFNLLALYINHRFALPIRRMSDTIQQQLGKLTETLIDLLGGLSVIKLFHLQPVMVEAYGSTNQRVTEAFIQRRRFESALDSTNYFLSMLSNVGTVIIGMYLVLRGLTDFGNLMGLISLQAMMNQSLLQAGSYLPQVQASLAGAARVFQLVDTPVEPERYVLAPVEPSSAEVECCHVTFRYAHGDNNILDELHITVPKGQVAALVGPSGSGKSTIFKLLQGFYPPSQGNIVIHGQPLDTYTLPELRDLIAYVPQDAYIFDGTIADNIRYGRLTASDGNVQAAAEMAYAHTFIMQQPGGYLTMVGERGTKLSGGQRQRIAIARALLKDAPILLLDEATSALDSQSEQLVQQALEELMKGRTTLVIAHRLSTIQHADIIYVIDQGRVVEYGQHHDLLKKGGLYKQLYDTQF